MTISTTATTAAPSRGPAIGLAVQGVLLATVAATLGLSTAGLVAAAVYGLALCGLLAAALRRAGMSRLGAPNVVTLSRAILIGGVIALVVTSFSRPVSVPALAVLAGVALALDGVDGQVARRTGATTALGARFDMEVDCVLVLVLSVYAGDRFGWWVVAIGAFRYAFGAASRVVPWLNAGLPPRFSRKVVAAVQGVVLAVVTANLLPHPAALAALVLVFGMLTWSFGLDVGWLYRAARTRRAARLRRPAPEPQPALVG